MIKVIKHGQTEFTHTCNRCGCEFTYEFEDIQVDSFSLNSTSAKVVKCPDCGNICYINANIGWPWPNSTLIPCDNLADTALNPCKDCDWHKKMIADGTTWYVGDTPCTWCVKNPMKVTCGGSIGSDSTTPKYQLYNVNTDSNKATCSCHATVDTASNINL